MGLADLHSSASEGSNFWNFDHSEGLESLAPTIRSNSTRRQVRFGDVQIRVYEQILTDNPACEGGPSLGIGWEYAEATKKRLSVGKFEAKRQRRWPHGRPPQKLSKQQRARIAYRAGYSKAQIKENALLISTLHKERNETLIELYGLTTVSVDEIRLFRFQAKEEVSQVAPTTSTFRRWWKSQTRPSKYRVLSDFVPIKVRNKPKQKGFFGRAA